MKVVSDSLHLQNANGTWRYVRRVPRHLMPVIGRQFIKHSLKTRERTQSRWLRPIEVMKADALFVAAETRIAQGRLPAPAFSPGPVLPSWPARRPQLLRRFEGAGDDGATGKASGAEGAGTMMARLLSQSRASVACAPCGQRSR